MRATLWWGTSCASVAPSISATPPWTPRPPPRCWSRPSATSGSRPSPAARPPAWVTIARNFLVEIGPPPVRPDRAVLQIKAYHAREDLLQILQKLARSGYTIALDEYDGALIDNVEELMGLCSIVRVDVSKFSAEELPRILRVPKMQGATLVATEVGDHAAFDRCKELGFTYFQGEYFAQPRTFKHKGVATSGLGSLRRLAELTAGDISFEDLERIISSDIGLSLKLLRY